MLGELPFTSRRNLFGFWNQTLPALLIGLFIRWTVFSSWKSAWTWGAAARFARIRSSSAFDIGGRERLGQEQSEAQGEVEEKEEKFGNHVPGQTGFAKPHRPRLRFCQGGCGQGEKDGGKQAPDQADGAGDAEPAQGRIIGQA